MTSLSLPVLRDLASRCKAATGPSREIDARIFCCYASCERNFVSFDNETRKLEYSSGSDNAWTYFRGPEYTASLDAAMALLDRRFPGAFYLLGRHPEPPFSAFSFSHGERQYSAEHNNRELAIVLCVILAEIERCAVGGVT